MQKIIPFLMFEGKAEEAMNFYLSLFEDSAIVSLTRNEGSAENPSGTILHAVFSLNGQTFMCIDSPVPHGFTFTPATSLYVPCDTEEEVDTLYAALSEGGGVLMPLASYPFSKKYAWITDRFGVSWQLSFTGI